MPAKPAPQQAQVYTLLTSPAALGAGVRSARTSMGLNLREAAKRCRVSVNFLQAMENGKPTTRLDKVLQVMNGMGLMAIVLPMEVVQAALAEAK